MFYSAKTNYFTLQCIQLQEEKIRFPEVHSRKDIIKFCY